MIELIKCRVAAIVVAAGLGVPSIALAQVIPEPPGGGDGGSGNCGTFYNCFGEKHAHKILGPVGSYDDRHGCSVCRDLFTWEPVHFSNCHGSCPTGGDDDEEELVYGDALDAARRGDAVTLLRLARVLPSRITVNRGRSSVQMRSCTGLLVANIPLPPSRLSYAPGMRAS